jgi:hypothetical protein
VTEREPSRRPEVLGNVGGFTRGAEVGARPGDYLMVWGKNCFFGYTVSPDGEIWWFANPPSRTEIPRNELRQLTTNELRERLVRLLTADKDARRADRQVRHPRVPPDQPVRPARSPGLAQRLDGDHRLACVAARHATPTGPPDECSSSGAARQA